jgi:hypothetical protein
MVEIFFGDHQPPMNPPRQFQQRQRCGCDPRLHRSPLMSPPTLNGSRSADTGASTPADGGVGATTHHRRLHPVHRHLVGKRFAQAPSANLPPQRSPPPGTAVSRRTSGPASPASAARPAPRRTPSPQGRAVRSALQCRYRYISCGIGIEVRHPNGLITAIRRFIDGCNDRCQHIATGRRYAI